MCVKLLYVVSSLPVKSLYAPAPELDVGPPLLGALLRMPWQLLRHRQLEGLKKRGFTDVHEAYLSVFQWPGPQGLRPAELAARTGMSRQAMNHLLGQLEATGYLRRQPAPAGSQGKRIDLTPRGETLGRTMREVIAEVEREWAQQLGHERLEQLRELLAQLCQITTPHTNAPSDASPSPTD